MTTCDLTVVKYSFTVFIAPTWALYAIILLCTLISQLKDFFTDLLIFSSFDSVFNICRFKRTEASNWGIICWRNLARPVFEPKVMTVWTKMLNRAKHQWVGSTSVWQELAWLHIKLVHICRLLTGLSAKHDFMAWRAEAHVPYRKPRNIFSFFPDNEW